MKQESVIIFSDSQINSYTDDIMRGDGVLEINLNSDQFTVLNMDGSIFESFHFKKGEYLIQNNTKDIIARKVILNYDFFSLSFDCNSFNKEDEFIYIYFNQELKKIDKSKYHHSYTNWIEYIKNTYIKLKEGNPIKIKSSDNIDVLDYNLENVYSVKDMIDDKLLLVSTSTGCCASTVNIEGVVKWKEGKKLMIDICVID
jgi:hypothetical protein